MGVIPTRYYVSMTVKDQPGVLSAVAAEFGKREVSIAEVRQKSRPTRAGGQERSDPGWGSQLCGARIVVVTHRPPMPRSRRPSPRCPGLDVVQSVKACCVWREPANEHYEVHTPWPGLIEAYRDRLPSRRTGRR